MLRFFKGFFRGQPSSHAGEQVHSHPPLWRGIGDRLGSWLGAHGSLHGAAAAV